MRDQITEKLYELSKKPYQKWFKSSTPWGLGIKELLCFPKQSLGYELGIFLFKNNFTIQDKLENHDVFHVLTNTGTSVTDEIAMQFYLLGNGKKSIYTLSVILHGTLFYPDKLKIFYRAFKRGRKADSFYNVSFKQQLSKPLSELQFIFSINTKDHGNK